MTSKAKRIILASVAPAGLQAMTVVAASLYFGNGKPGDQSVGFILVLITGVILSAIILRHDSFDGFWRMYLYSCLVAVLPIALLTAGIAIFNGTRGYFWLGVTIMTFLILLVTLISLPVTYFVYAYLRALNADT